MGIVSVVNFITNNLTGILIILTPLFIPLLFRKWIWFFTSLIGYILYVLWGIYLHYTSDITGYGTGYGIFIVPYLIMVTVVGAILQKSKNN